MSPATAGRTCPPSECGHVDVPPAIAPPLPPAPPPPPPAVPALLTRQERAQYRLAFGILGQLGELTINVSPALGGDASAHLAARAHGSLFGLEETKKGLDTDLDPRSLAAQRWTSFRASGGTTVTDFAQQPAPGSVALLRRHSG